MEKSITRDEKSFNSGKIIPHLLKNFTNEILEYYSLIYERKILQLNDLDLDDRVRLEYDIFKTQQISKAYQEACDYVCYSAVNKQLNKYGIYLPQRDPISINKLENILYKYKDLEIPWKTKVGYRTKHLKDCICEYPNSTNKYYQSIKDFCDCFRNQIDNIKPELTRYNPKQIDIKRHYLYSSIKKIDNIIFWSNNPHNYKTLDEESQKQIFEIRGLYNTITTFMQNSLFLQTYVISESHFHFGEDLHMSQKMKNILKKEVTKAIKQYEKYITKDIEKLNAYYKKLVNKIKPELKTEINQSKHSVETDVSQKLDKLYDELNKIDGKLKNPEAAYQNYLDNHIEAYCSNEKLTFDEFRYNLKNKYDSINNEMIALLIKYPESNKPEYKINIEEKIVEAIHRFEHQSDEIKNAIAYHIYIKWIRYYSSTKNKANILPYEEFALENFGVEVSVPEECISQYKELGFEAIGLKLYLFILK